MHVVHTHYILNSVIIMWFCRTFDVLFLWVGVYSRTWDDIQGSTENQALCLPESFTSRWGKKRPSQILSQQIYPGKHKLCIADVHYCAVMACCHIRVLRSLQFCIQQCQESTKYLDLLAFSSVTVYLQNSQLGILCLFILFLYDNSPVNHILS